MDEDLKSKKEKNIEEIFKLYKDYGCSNYIGEKIDQNEHAIQCALHAQEMELPKEVVVGALLHDIGHLIGEKQKTESMDNWGIKDHEYIGPKYLRELGICEEVCDLIENHVTVKRYLVYKDEKYAKRLSEASKNTLIFQGGAFTKEQAEEYEKKPNLKMYIKLRLCDEKAKVEGMTLPPFSEFKDLIMQCMS